MFISAIFFSYIDPKTLIMDTGFTEHSGCPVFEGEKKIVTQASERDTDVSSDTALFSLCRQ